MNIAMIGDTQVEKNNINAKSISSLSQMAIIDTKNNVSGKNHRIQRAAKSIIVSIQTMIVMAAENQANFHNIIIPLRTGLESIRYIVLHSISRDIIPPQIKSTIAKPVISIKERPKSNKIRRISPKARVSSKTENRINITPRKAIRPKNLLRIISRNVLSAILNMAKKFLVIRF